MMKKTLLSLLFCAASGTLAAQSDSSDSSDLSDKSDKSELALSFRFAPQEVLALDEYVKTWLKDKASYSLSLEGQLDTYQRYVVEGKTDADADYARDYGYPTFAVGLRYNFNHGTTMHRDAADWGEDMEVPYTTHLGDIITLYGRFDRPLFRTRRWSGGYSLGLGVGYALSRYDKTAHIDNEFIGAPLNIFFTAGAYVNYQLSPDWTLTAGLDFSHHSNGALYRPNKGANYLGPFLGASYSLRSDRSDLSDKSDSSDKSEKPARAGSPFFLELTLGIGAKTLNEDWQQTQFNSDPSDPDYRTSRFPVYAAFSVQADVMYRYARRWASGVGFDVFYGSYHNKLKTFAGNAGDHISPWSLALAVKHEVFYGRLTARMGVGVYLYRHMGSLAKEVETPYYERVGLTYTLSRRTGVAVGFSVNAHKTKADFTEVSLAIPFKL